MRRMAILLICHARICGSRQQQKKLKEYHAPADHYSTLSTMFYQLGLSTAPLHEVIRHIREGEYKRESSQDYRQQELEDFQNKNTDA